MTTDLRQALRALRRAPAFSAAVILTLALGIGANTALFSVADAILLRPLPYADPDRLVAIDDASLLVNWRGDLRPEVQASAAFVAVGTHITGAVNIGGDPTPARVRAAAVSVGFFEALDLRPIEGRVFTTDDLQVDLRQVVVSHALWTRRGRSLTPGGELLVNGRPFVVVGILPPRVDFPGGAEVWIPSGADSQIAGGASAPAAIARLAPGVTVASARAQVRRIVDAAVGGNRDATERTARIVRLHQQLAGPVRPVLLVLAIAVGLVLLVACLNVASLWLARVSARGREIATRCALGATGMKILRPLFYESALLSAASGLLAVPVAMWTLAAIRVVIPAAPVGSDTTLIDGRALVATGALCMAATFVFGAAPAWSLRRASTTGRLRATASRTVDPFWRRFRSALVIAQLAISLVLVASAATVAQTVGALMSVDLGASGERALTAETTLPLARYDSLEQLDAFYVQVEAALRRLPGVERVGFTNRLPGSRQLGIGQSILIDGRAAPEGVLRRASYLAASPDYFESIGIPLLAGRYFIPGDRAGAPPVAIVSESVVRRVGLSPAEAIGERVAIGARGSAMATIVGIVRDVRLQGPEVEAGAQVYVPLAQQPSYGTTFVVVKTLGDPTALAPALRTAVASIDPSVPIYGLQTFAQIRDSFLAARRFAQALLTAFAALALILAGVGLYGVLTYLVQLRTPEIGIRMALGAAPHVVRWQVVKEGLRHATAAIAIGAALSPILLRVMTSVIPGLHRPDFAVLAAASAAVLIVVIPIAWLPTRRATAIDPVNALRTE